MENIFGSADNIILAQRDLCMALASVTNTSKAASICLDMALRISGMEAGSVRLINERGHWDIAAHNGLSSAFVNAAPFPSDSSRAKTALSGKPVYVSLDDSFWNSIPFIKDEGLLSLGIIPIVHNNRVLASLNVASRIKTSFSKTARTALEMAAATAGSALVRTRIQEALVKSEEKYRLLSQNAAEAIGIIQDGLFKFPNPAALSLFGCTNEEAAQIYINKHIHSQDREKFDRDYALILGDEDASGASNLRILTVSGATKQVCVNSVRIMWEDRPAVLSIIRDITNEKYLEAQLRQAQKMEAIGTLAGGIAHNFNNILSSIMGFTELCLEDVPEYSQTHANLRKVLESSRRAADLVNQILTFSRQDSMERKPLALAPVVTETVSLLYATIPSSIEIISKVPGEPCAILGNASQIQQIIMSLCSNASHAMTSPEGGTLKITLDCVSASSQDMGGADVSFIPAVRLMISDTGHGMDEQTQKRIFDPYFTTREPDKGTGLGLAVVHGVVKAHHGAISVKSTPDAGTVFTILFPRIEACDDHGHDKPAVLLGNQEQVLFVDDEPALAELGEAMLNRLNYKAIVCQNPVDALEVFRARSKNIGLVITDQTMPNMTGEALIKRIRDIRPDIPIIACTGHSDFFDMQKANNLKIQAFCRKPLSYSQFSKTLHRVFSESKKQTSSL